MMPQPETENTWSYGTRSPGHVMAAGQGWSQGPGSGPMPALSTHTQLGQHPREVGVSRQALRSAPAPAPRPRAFLSRGGRGEPSHRPVAGPSKQPDNSRGPTQGSRGGREMRKSISFQRKILIFE